MVIRRLYLSKSNKIHYELIGQQSFFGKDNLSFKTVNLPKAQRLNNICHIFRLKKIVKKFSLSIPTFQIINFD